VTVHIWEIRNPDGASMGLEVARGRMEPHADVLAHALPERVDIDVCDEAGRLVARGRELPGLVASPIARLWLRGDEVGRENVWPDETDLGKPVILPGGEVGILTAWWHAEDQRSWRWSIELSNHV
jgi:hypothetical protein